MNANHFQQLDLNKFINIVNVSLHSIGTDEDSTPPPMKKQRKSSSSDSDFYETQSGSKANESKIDEQSASTSLTTSTPKSDDKVTSQKSQCTDNDDQPQDDEMNGKKAENEQRSKVNLSTSPTSLSNSSSVSTGSSPESHSLPINTSTDHEQSIEKDMERKLLRKIEYHLMDIFQHLEENETAESESGSSRYTQPKNNCTSDTSTTSTSHKISSTTSSVADEDIINEPGPSQ